MPIDVEFGTHTHLKPHKKEKGLAVLNLLTLVYYTFGRCDRIRTYDPLHPMQVRYRAAPHTEVMNSSSRGEPDGRPKLLRIKQIGNR